jgi:hypothetical protein
MSKESSITQGSWLDPKTKIWYNDINRKIWIDCDSTLFNLRYLKRLKIRLKKLLEQEDIYITISQINTLLD